MDKLGHLLWTIGKTAVVVAIVEVMTIALIPSVAAANVYIGGYLTNSECYDTTQVIMSCRVPPVEVADGNFLAGVLSVAGVEDGDLSGAGSIRLVLPGSILASCIIVASPGRDLLGAILAKDLCLTRWIGQAYL
jgi:hypothetical protein